MKQMNQPGIMALCVLSLFGLHAAGAVGGDKPAPAAPERPNVILILTDDQGYGDVGAHGNPVLKTPNLDRLHEGSVRFTDFHAAPMCSPTRGQLMTGLDAMRNGSTFVCRGRSMMRRELPTMADFFARSGYATGHFGKWHLGDSYPHRPRDRGFQETLHHRAWGITSLADSWRNTYFNPVLAHNGQDQKYAGYCTDIFFSEAIRWIRAQQAAGRPFFAYLATNTPHTPDMAPSADSAPYAKIGTHAGTPLPAAFYGQIANLDANLGQLDRCLQQTGLLDNTVLIFMTDNGTRSPQAKAVFNAGMRGMKGDLYEGGHRVPFFVRWPAGRLRHGTDVGALTEVQDVLPTLIELCGLDAGDARFDGVSLAGLLRGTRETPADRKLVVQYNVSGEPWQSAAVLWKKWRLVGPTELYDLRADPGQQRNVAGEHLDIVKVMIEHYEQWHAEAKPLFDKPRRIHLGSDKAEAVMLYANDWDGDYCDNAHGLYAGAAVGAWDVTVERDGEYTFELRRWPFEADLPLRGDDGKGNGNGARPIARARLKIGGEERVADTAPGDKAAAFAVQLKAGKTRLETLFMDQDGKPLCSAMYVKVTRR